MLRGRESDDRRRSLHLRCCGFPVPFIAFLFYFETISHFQESGKGSSKDFFFSESFE